jgi:hypothetical protein
MSTTKPDDLVTPEIVKAAKAAYRNVMPYSGSDARIRAALCAALPMLTESVRKADVKVADKWAGMKAEEIRLRFGEMTTEQVRLVRGTAMNIAAAIRSGK